MARFLLLVGTLGRMFDLHVHIGIPNGYSDQDAAHARSLLLVRHGIGLAPPPAEISVLNRPGLTTGRTGRPAMVQSSPLFFGGLR
jgi:hypothetical protein